MIINKLLYIILTLFCFNSNQIELHPIYCAPELKKTFEVIKELPQVRDLIDSIRQEGPIRIEVNRKLSKEFEGYWHSGDRTVYITMPGKTSEGAILCTLLFELHNASRDKEINLLHSQAFQRRLDKKTYVEAVEHLEYQNAIATSLLLEEGMHKGLFPSNSNCFMGLPSHFQDHLMIQKRSGHSAWIAREYDQLMNLS